MAEVVAVQLHAELALPAGVGGDLAGVVVQGGDRSPPGQYAHPAEGFRGLKAAASGLHVGDGPPDLCRRDLQAEAVPGLQQDRLRLHQTLPDGAIGRLPEVAALGVLDVCFTCGEGDLHVGERRADPDAQMLLFGQMGQDQALPVPVQTVLAALGRQDQTAAPGQGL